MKTIGLLGGMSWESTALYYQTINRAVRDADPSGDGLNSAPIILNSLDFSPVAAWMRDGDWTAISKFLAQQAQILEAAGAQTLGLCTNTMHKVFDVVADAVNIPILHIASPTIAALKAAGVTRAGFLGTQFSMSERFLWDEYAKHDIALIVPNAAQQAVAHDIIMRELCQGVVSDTSRATYVRMIDDLAAQGAEALVLGCTEITLLIQPNDCALPLFDTADLHAKALAAVCLTD